MIDLDAVLGNAIQGHLNEVRQGEQHQEHRTRQVKINIALTSTFIA